MANKDGGAGFKTGFLLGTLVGGMVGYLAAVPDEEHAPDSTVGRLKQLFRRFRAIVLEAFDEGRAAAKEARNERPKGEDLDLDDPSI